MCVYVCMCFHVTLSCVWVSVLCMCVDMCLYVRTTCTYVRTTCMLLFFSKNHHLTKDCSSSTVFTSLFVCVHKSMCVCCIYYVCMYSYVSCMGVCVV